MSLRALVSMSSLAVVTFTFALTLVACGPGERGFECESDDQCAPGLLCIETEDFNPAGTGDEQCVAGQKLCTNPCADDAGCAQFGEGLICVQQGPNNECDGACLVGSRG